MQKKDNCSEEDSEQYYEENRDHDFAFTANDPSKDMLEYLRRVAIEKRNQGSQRGFLGQFS